LKYPAMKLALLVVLAAALAGCSSNVFEDGKFSKLGMPELLPKSDSSTPVKSAEGDFMSSAPVAPEDYVDASGACAGSAPAAPQAAENAVGPDAAPAPPPVAGGIALGMTECQVVQRAGQPGNVEISAEANSSRATVLTYMTGTWPGIYRFSAGRLKEIERVAAPPPPPKAVKKKKAAKPKTAAR
jgi:hypothetical protein